MRELLRRPEIKFFSRLAPGFLFKLLDLFTQRLALTVEQLCVDQRSGPLHTEEYTLGRKLDLFINTRKLLPRVFRKLHCEAGVKPTDRGRLLDAAPGCLFGFHFVSRLFRRAFSKHLFGSRNIAVQPAKAQTLKLMAVMRFKHIILKPRVIEPAGSGGEKTDPFIRHHVKHKFGAVRDFPRLSLKPGLQPLNHRLLLRSPNSGLACQRHVPAPRGARADRETRQTGSERLRAVRKNLQPRRNHRILRGRERFKRFAECRLIHDQLIGDRILCGRRCERHQIRIHLRGKRREEIHLSARLRSLFARLLHCPRELLLRSASACLHFPAAVERLKRLLIRIPDHEIRLCLHFRNFDRGPDGDEIPSLLEEREPLPQVFADLPLHFRGVLADTVKTPVLRDPLRRGLRAALIDSGNVIDLVSHEREVINDPGGRNAEFRGDTRFIEHLVAHRIDRHDFAILNELIEILVAGRDKALDAAGLRPGGESSDHVIRLNALLNDELPAHRHDKLLNRADLAREIIRHRRAVGFVFRKDIGSERLPLRVKNTDAEIRFHDRPHGSQH